MKSVLFWRLYWQIIRLEAEADLRAMSNHASCLSQENYTDRTEMLKDIVRQMDGYRDIINAKADPDASDKLKRLASF